MEKLYDINFFENIDAEEKAYFLGLLFADGCVAKNNNTVSISLKKEDSEILSIFSNILYKKDKLGKVKVKENKDYGRVLCFRDKKTKQDLINLGCVPAKTFKIKLPNLDNEMMRHFFRGYFDGDGCLTIARGRSSKSCKRPTFKIVSSTNFCNELSDYFKKKYNLNIGVYHPSANKNVGSFQSGNDEIIKFLYNYMYKNSKIFLKRKKEKFDNYLNLLCVRPPKWDNYIFVKNGIEYKTQGYVKFARDNKIWEKRFQNLIEGKVKEVKGFILKDIIKGQVCHKHE